MTDPLAHEYWQRIDPPGTHDEAPPGGFRASFPARLPDGSQLLLPIRVLPGDGTRAGASLIVNQASFAVEDALSRAMADIVAELAPEVIVGVPTLGLPLAGNLARRLGHARMIALGTSRKFWYRDELSEPLKSITSPGGGKSIFLDPRMLSLLEGRRILVVDDVLSTGSSMVAVLRLLRNAGLAPVGVAAAMLQTRRWQGALAEAGLVPQGLTAAGLVRGVIASPGLVLGADGGWHPEV